MSLTLLQMVNTAQAELGLPVSATIFGNADLSTVQLRTLANRVLDELRSMHTWTQMQFEFNLVVQPPTITTGNINTASPAVITNIAAGTAAQAANPYSWAVVGASIPAAARILSVDSGTQVTMDMQSAITANVAATPITFAQDTYAMPAGFDWFQNRTMWDRTNRWELLGPDSPQMDQWHRSGIVVTGPRRHWRKLGPNANQFRIWPAPIEITTPLQLVFEFLSNAAVMVHGSNTSFAQYFANDDDQVALSDQAVVMGLEWMFWQRKGFNYSDMKNDWIDYVERLIARDGAAATLQLAKKLHPVFISPAATQDGFFPGPVGPNMS
jgi:hypothetical protein